MPISASLSTDAGYALYTYYNYIKAWVIRSENTYGSGQKGIDNLVNKMKSIASVNDLKADIWCSDELRSNYLRGRYTLLFMSTLPINDHPELALSANMWLPVQSYYAIHGVGLALLTVLKQPAKNHSTFRACFAALLRSFFPPPFCACCKGGPSPSSFSYTAICTSAAHVAKQSNIANPKFSEVDHFLGKSLATTRNRNIKEQLDKERRKNRKGTKRRKLSVANQQEICQKLHDTTICDLIYRMRVRSNYENPEMYLFASDNLEDAASHYKDLLYLTNLIIAGLDLLIEKKIGKLERTKLTGIIASVK